MNNNDVACAASCKSLLRRVRRLHVSPATAVQGPTTQEFDEPMIITDYVEFQGEINDIDGSERPSFVEARVVRRNGTARRSRPDAKGRINGKECHAFAFADLIEEEIAGDF